MEKGRVKSDDRTVWRFNNASNNQWGIVKGEIASPP